MIDFEASSLEDDSYPIEVGLAFWPSPEEAMSSWSTLIKPTCDWTRNGHWSPKSAKVHGIRGSDLVASGQSLDRVAATLNEMLGPGRIAWCDGDAYELYWLGKLFTAANTAPLFRLGAWHHLMTTLGPSQRERGLT